MLQTLRDEVLAVTPEDIRRTAVAVREAGRELYLRAGWRERVREK
ncbi:MAG: hypothetical protein ACLTXL_13630 [Clostridia bacterium]